MPGCANKGPCQATYKNPRLPAAHRLAGSAPENWFTPRSLRNNVRHEPLEKILLDITNGCRGKTYNCVIVEGNAEGRVPLNELCLAKLYHHRKVTTRQGISRDEGNTYNTAKLLCQMPSGTVPLSAL